MHKKGLILLLIMTSVIAMQKNEDKDKDEEYQFARVCVEALRQQGSVEGGISGFKSGTVPGNDAPPELKETCKKLLRLYGARIESYLAKKSEDK